MFLNYLALFMIVVVLIAIYYIFIYIHELPYEAAKHRNHPQADAIYVACWLSLFTLHAIWPLVYLWALSHKQAPDHATAEVNPTVADWSARVTQLEARIKQLEQRSPKK